MRAAIEVRSTVSSKNTVFQPENDDTKNFTSGRQLNLNKLLFDAKNIKIGPVLTIFVIDMFALYSFSPSSESKPSSCGRRKDDGLVHELGQCPPPKFEKLG